eukprot:COSAG01_NODE_72526_length_252_cov_3.091503_1_plen_24_part_10
MPNHGGRIWPSAAGLPAAGTMLPA